MLSTHRLAKYFPHEITDIEDVCNRLQSNQDRSWEERYILFLWASVMIMNPFPLHEVISFDSLIVMTQKALGDTGKTKDAASLFLARALTRSDMQNELNAFILFAIEAFSLDDLYLVIRSYSC